MITNIEHRIDLHYNSMCIARDRTYRRCRQPDIISKPRIFYGVEAGKRLQRHVQKTGCRAPWYVLFVATCRAVDESAVCDGHSEPPPFWEHVEQLLYVICRTTPTMLAIWIAYPVLEDEDKDVHPDDRLFRRPTAGKYRQDRD